MPLPPTPQPGGHGLARSLPSRLLELWPSPGLRRIMQSSRGQWIAVRPGVWLLCPAALALAYGLRWSSGLGALPFSTSGHRHVHRARLAARPFSTSGHSHVHRASLGARPFANGHGRVRRACLRESPSGEQLVDMEEWPELHIPRHRSNAGVNRILERAESLVLERLHSAELHPWSPHARLRTDGKVIGLEDRVYANNYVNLDAAEVFGFDYDYTLVSYKPALLDLLYDQAKAALVEHFSYPTELLHDLAGYDPSFAIRGLAVDLETAWVCKLTYRHRVAAAFFGRERVDTQTLRDTYKSRKGAGVLPSAERKARLRPLNDLFSLAEACLLADVVQWFRDRSIPFEPKSVVNDVLKAVGQAHISGDMHRAVVADMDKFIEPDSTKHMRQLLTLLREAGKQLMLVSNSEFWYVDAGMSNVVGPDWRDLFDVVVVSAGKPAFYTQARPFREVSTRTGRIKYKPVTSLEPGEVYFGGSLNELMRLTNWTRTAGGGSVDGSKIFYFGDSLFADLVEARRLYGWTTGAIIRELRDEMHVQHSRASRMARYVLRVLLHAAQLCQEEMGPEASSSMQRPHTKEDRELLDVLEGLVTEWRQRQDGLMNANFGSIFRTSPCEGVRSTPSLFARCLHTHVDLYTSRVENLRLYSTDHRFYPTEERAGMPHEAMYPRDHPMDLVRRLSS